MNSHIQEVPIANNITNQSKNLSPKEQSLSLQLALQLNRDLLTHTLIQHKNNRSFPRSYTMRFLMQYNTQKILNKFAGHLIGNKTLKALTYGFGFAQLYARSRCG